MMTEIQDVCRRVNLNIGDAKNALKVGGLEEFTMYLKCALGGVTKIIKYNAGQGKHDGQVAEFIAGSQAEIRFLLNGVERAVKETNDDRGLHESFR